MKRTNFIIVFILIQYTAVLISCKKQHEETQTTAISTGAGVTILEFGSTCVPCAKMKIILDLLVEDYGDVVAVDFIDTGSGTGKKRAEENKIRIIPSQIFLDSNGNEFYRHDGYLPQENILSILKKQGIIK